MAAVSCGTSHVTTQQNASTPLRWEIKTRRVKLQSLIQCCMPLQRRVKLQSLIQSCMRLQRRVQLQSLIQSCMRLQRRVQLQSLIQSCMRLQRRESARKQRIASNKQSVKLHPAKRTELRKAPTFDTQAVRSSCSRYWPCCRFSPSPRFARGSR